MKALMLVATMAAGLASISSQNVALANDDVFDDAFGTSRSSYDRFRAVSGKKLRAVVTNRRVYLHTPLGAKLPINYASNGTMTGEGGKLAKYLSSKKYVVNDTGTWWISRNFLCQKWQNWLKRKKTTPLSNELATASMN